MLWILLAMAYAAVAAWVALVAVIAWRLRRMPVSFREPEPVDWGIVGRAGFVLTPIQSVGSVRVRGEIWRAISVDGSPLASDAAVMVVDQREPMLAVVRPISASE